MMSTVSADMPTPWYQTAKCTDLTLLAFIFFIPLSSTLKSIALVGAVLAIFRYRIHRSRVTYLLSQPWVRILTIFLLWVGIECFLSPATIAEQGYVLEKYSKLLWLPVLSLGFTDAHIRRRGLQTFLAAMFFTALVAFALHSWGWIHTELPAGSVFRNHIITGHMMAFAAYLAASFALEHSPRWRLYSLIFVILTYELLFVSQGRTGYLMYFLLMTLFVLQKFKSWRKILGLLGVCLFAATTFYTSTIVHQRYQKAQKDVVLMQADKNKTSLGYRMQFQKFAYTLVKESPLLGHGTGSFTYYFAKRNPIPAWQRIAREPHNQYWMIATELGAIGLCLYLGLLFFLCRAAQCLPTYKHTAFALLLPFIIGSYSESLLFFSGCGYFFLTMLALCLSEANDTGLTKNNFQRGDRCFS